MHTHVETIDHELDQPKKYLINDDDFEEGADDSVGEISPLATVLGVLCFPCTLMCSFFCVRENTEAVVLHYGKFTGVRRTAGLHFVNCWGRDLRVVTRQKQSLHLPITKIVDKTGNPVNVSGIVVFYNIDSKKKCN